jgi:hypothetical protein
MRESLHSFWYSYVFILLTWLRSRSFWIRTFQHTSKMSNPFSSKNCSPSQCTCARLGIIFAAVAQGVQGLLSC